MGPFKGAKLTVGDEDPHACGAVQPARRAERARVALTALFPYKGAMDIKTEL